MATRDVTAAPKLRSRKHGAAVPLDDADRKLLNLMQGRFPLEPRPYLRVAEAVGIPEERAIERVQELIDDRIIRQVTPIYDTRALGYGSMLVAAKVDAEHLRHRGVRALHDREPALHDVEQPLVELVERHGRAALAAAGLGCGAQV